MTVPRSVADVLADHVTLEVECIDRMYLNLYIPKLVYPAGVVGLFKGHRDMPLASGALMDPISRDFVASVHRLIRDEGVDLVHFAKGQRKDDVALGYLARHDGSEGITFVGRAQEKCTVFRTERRVNPRTGARYPFIVRASAVVNQYYFYGADTDFGPFFFKFSTYFPYTAKCSHQRAPLGAAPGRQGRHRLGAPSTTASPAVTTPPRSRQSVTASGLMRSRPSWTSGWPVSRVL